MLRKNSIAIRIGVDPKTFSDEKGWVERKRYKDGSLSMGRDKKEGLGLKTKSN
ncbi:MAG: hypothetical protein QW201_02375 [Thermoproteota archaeon]